MSRIKPETLENPKGHDSQRGPPRAGIGAHGAAQNPIIANLNTGGSADGSGEPAEKFSLFLSGIPASLDDRWLHDVLEVAAALRLYELC